MSILPESSTKRNTILSFAGAKETHRQQKAIAAVTGLLTALLAILAFVLSFNALADLAAQKGVSIPPLFPIVIEGGMIVFSLAALRKNLQGEAARWQWVLIISSTALATGFNILHAPVDPVSRAMAAVPSVFLLLSFETLLSQVKSDVTRTAALASLQSLESRQSALTTEINTLTANGETTRAGLEAQAQTLTAKIDTLKAELAGLRKEKTSEQLLNLGILDDANKVRADKREVAKEALLEYLLDNPDATLSEAGRYIGRSRQTASEYARELAAIGLHKNGNGWELTEAA